MEPIPDDLDQARVLAYQDPLRSRRLAVEVATRAEARGDAVTLAWARWLVALADVRSLDPVAGDSELAAARAGFAERSDTRGLRLCDELRAIALRRAGDISGCRTLLDEIDRRSVPADDFDTFLAHSSRGLTLKHLGLTDLTLSHFYAAADAAERLGWVGPRVVATANLGSFHLDLCNLDDALALCRRAQQAALSAGMPPIIASATASLIQINWALGLGREARTLSDFLIANEQRLLPGALAAHAGPIALGYLAGRELRLAQRWLDRVPDGGGVARRDLVAWVRARVHLEQGDATAACAAVEARLAEDDTGRVGGAPFDRLELLRAAADAFERHGDLGRAMAFLRRAQQVHEDLLGRGARARWRALQADASMRQAQRERDDALRREREAEVDRQRLQALNQALQAQILTNERLQATLREQALRDPLTGLHNRRHLAEMAPGLIAAARRHGRPLSLAVMTLDPLPQVVDRLGHTEGDRLLVACAEVLQREVRACDAVCRRDGEAFVLLMPDTDSATAVLALERLQRALRKSGTRLRAAPGEAAISFSAGIATLAPEETGVDLEALLRRADTALQDAKAAGRIRTEPA